MLTEAHIQKTVLLFHVKVCHFSVDDTEERGFREKNDEV